MAYKIEGETCPICKSYLFDEDDVVFCPVCGAPHHRDCYAAVGHCGLKELHGTADQYTPKTEDDDTKENPSADGEGAKIKCTRCGRDLVSGALFCPYCGQDLSGEKAPHSHGGFYQAPQQGAAPFGPGFVPFIDPYGGIPHDGSVTIEGESVENVKNYVFANSHRYVPLFYRQSKKNKSSWNWSAFLFPGCWLCFRKHYTAGIIALALWLFSLACFMPLTADMNALLTNGAPVTQDMLPAQVMEYVATLMPKIPLQSYIFSCVGIAIVIARAVFFGLMGDWIYRKKVLSSIKDIRTNPDIDDTAEAISRRGGTNLWAFLLAWLVCVNWAPGIIMSFF